jgi:hypothetical protein
MSELMREQRLQIMRTENELRAIGDWRFGRCMPARPAAVRELLWMIIFLRIHRAKGAPQTPCMRCPQADGSAVGNAAPIPAGASFGCTSYSGTGCNAGLENCRMLRF